MWQRLRYDVPNFKWDRRRKYGWRSFETFTKGMLFEIWHGEDKPTVWFGTSQVEDKTVEQMLIEAGDPAIGTTFDEIKQIHGFAYTPATVAVDYALSKGWLTEDQILEALHN